MEYLKLYESFVDSDGKLKGFFNLSGNLYYPYNELKPYIDEFQNRYSDYTEKQGWGIFDSDTERANDKYQKVVDNTGRIVYNFNYWDIEKFDDGELEKDIDAIELAKEMGIIVDEYGVIQGFNDVNLVALFNDGKY